MQLLATDDSYFIKSARSILKCCRITANLSVFKHSDLASIEDFELLGDVFCYIGKITIEDVSYLLLVIECTEIANLSQPEASIWRIDKVCALPILDDGLIHKRLFEAPPVINGLGSKLKAHPKRLVKFVSNKVPTRNLPFSPKFIEDIVSFFNQSNSFYFSQQIDLTKTLQSGCINPGNYDERFFWNRELLREFFVNDGTPIPAFRDWITPIIYGYIDQKRLCFDVDEQTTMTLISRRSSKRAGVRYLRRGIDTNGDVANFVETEFIVFVYGHSLSYTQCRGSVPVFWSQTGYKLRPPLSIDRVLEESFPAFKTHVDKMLRSYGPPLVMVNLVDQSGREVCLGESYLQHVLQLNSPEVAYHSFDFHKNCGARRLHMVQELVKTLEDQIKKIGFCWMDKAGQMVQRQKGIIRTNCVDCLDRTNVVQSAISQAVCLNQCRKLGLVEPINEAPEALVRLLQSMWADHGDSISRQYAGTNALKGDITRSGQRKLSGFMKDGYNSASRYYLSHFSDAQRQRIIDAIVSGGAAAADVIEDGIEPPMNRNGDENDSNESSG